MNKPTVILLSAKAQSGKDYTSNIIKNKLEFNGKKVLITHYADLLKYICKTFFGWDGQKDEVGRTLLQRVGTNEIRKKNPNYWVNFVKGIITMFPNEWDYILIPDTRFPNEISVMKSCSDFNTISVRINRPNFENSLTEKQRNHESETALDDYRFDAYIINDENIEKNVDEFIKRFLVFDKKTIFCDLDGTLFDTIECITNLYNKDYMYYKDYKYVDPVEITDWNWKQLQLADKNTINNYFNNPRFFDTVRCYEYGEYAIKQLSNRYDVVFVSIGSYANLKLKEIYIHNNYPFAKFIGLDNKENNDKSSIDMSNGIFIDDRNDNLVNSNADIKICFGREYDWNKDFDDMITNNFRYHNWYSLMNSNIFN